MRRYDRYQTLWRKRKFYIFITQPNKNIHLLLKTINTKARGRGEFDFSRTAVRNGQA